METYRMYYNHPDHGSVYSQFQAKSDEEAKTHMRDFERDMNVSVIYLIRQNLKGRNVEVYIRGISGNA